MLRAPAPIDFAEHQLTGHQTSSYIEFIHGTTTSAGIDVGVMITATGGGEYGKGFYAFLHTGPDAGRGKARATDWAIGKAGEDESGNTGAVLVYLRISMRDLQALDFVPMDETDPRLPCNDDETVFDGEESVIFGPHVGFDWATGLFVVRRGLPTQYKFQGEELPYLRVHRVEDVVA